MDFLVILMTQNKTKKEVKEAVTHNNNTKKATYISA